MNIINVPATETPAVVDQSAQPAGRDDLIAALEGVDLAAAAEETPEQVQAAQTKAAADAVAAADKPAEDNTPEVVRLIRAREQAQKVRDEGKSAADQLLEQARADADRIRAEARETAQREAQAEIQRQLAGLREKPMEAIQRIGWKPQDLVDSVVREGDPQWQALQQIRAEQAKLAERAQTAEEKAASVETLAKQQAEYWQQQQRAAAERDFVAISAQSPIKAVAEQYVQAAKMLGQQLTVEQVLINQAHAAADTIKAAGGVASPQNVLQYLEYMAQQSAGDAAGSPSGTATQVATQTKQVPTGRANGSRTLSAAGASDRRSAPKPIHEMTAAEERAALIEEANAAMRESSR